jgi:hypothetical protein
MATTMSPWLALIFIKVDLADSAAWTLQRLPLQLVGSSRSMRATYPSPEHLTAPGSSACRRRKPNNSSNLAKVQRRPLWMCSTSPCQSPNRPGRSGSSSRHRRTRKEAYRVGAFTQLCLSHSQQNKNCRPSLSSSLAHAWLQSGYKSASPSPAKICWASLRS